MAENESSRSKKQVPLRLSASLYEELARWADDDFRSINGQIEFLLTECVKYRKRSGKKGKSESEIETEKVLAALADLSELIMETKE